MLSSASGHSDRSDCAQSPTEAARFAQALPENVRGEEELAESCARQEVSGGWLTAQSTRYAIAQFLPGVQDSAGMQGGGIN